MLKSRWFFLLLGVLVSAQVIAQGPDTFLYPLPPGEDGQRFIDQLKEIPVKQIERGLPDESFDSWFSRLVKPKVVEYKVGESRKRTGSVYQTTLWVVAYTQPPQPDGGTWVEVRFMVVDVKPSKTERNRGAPKPFVLRFYDAALEAQTLLQPPYHVPSYPTPIPPGPLTKSPYEVFSELSALEEGVRRSQGKETPRKLPL